MELPQMFNVLKGEMSIVGPRPDLPGYYDLLEGENRKILELKPGLTSPQL
jgi:lipopolysaccharide/colanic/teichoic acid biosynthesis glycosyltransferase